MIHDNPILLRSRSGKSGPRSQKGSSAGQTDFELHDLLGRTIDHGRLKLVDKLGEGSFGVVFRAENQWSASSSSSGKGLAVKVMKKAKPGNRRWVYQMRELAAHQALSRHSNILTLHQIIEDDEFYYMVMDYCPGGDLYQTVLDNHFMAGQTERIKRIFVQLLDAVEFCHEMGIAHRDLKPDNIFCGIGDAEHVVLGDFGMATWLQTSTSHRCGSGPYMSPGMCFPRHASIAEADRLFAECIGELYDYRPFSTQKSDIWSLGVILTNMITGLNPWGSASTSDRCFRRYVNNPECLRTYLPISKEANTILQRIFTLDPQCRITIPELREMVSETKTFYMSKEEMAAMESNLLRIMYQRGRSRLHAPDEQQKYLHSGKTQPQNYMEERYEDDSDDESLVTVVVRSAKSTTPNSVPSLSNSSTLYSNSCEAEKLDLSPDESVKDATELHKAVDSGKGKGVDVATDKDLSPSVDSLVDQFKIVL